MASKRISQELAKRVANEIADVSYNEKIANARKKVQDYADRLVDLSIPHSVLKVIITYPKYFRTSSILSVKCGERFTLTVTTSFKIPMGCTIEVCIGDYNKLKELKEELRAWIIKRDAFFVKIFNALCELRTVKRVGELLPEAIPYLEHILNCGNINQISSDDFESLRQNILTPKKNGQEKK